jgi:DNA polymerase-3 subunit epsilon
MREVVLDTETTGLDPKTGHRVVEIGCLELINHLPTNRAFQRYINPERDMPAEAYEVHGLSAEFLAQQTTFSEIVDDFLAFIGDDKLIIHNAEFDLRFLNAELGRMEQPPIPSTRAIDTVQLARRRFPGAQASLDALCRRFGIDNTDRVKHGALLDAELLAGVYLELIGGRQANLTLAHAGSTTAGATPADSPVRPSRPHAPSADEEARHAAFVDGLTKPIWRR